MPLKLSFRARGRRLKKSPDIAKKPGWAPGKPVPPFKLEDIPNIGKSIASDLRAIGILHPEQLGKIDPLATYHALSAHMAHRSDPCVLYTLMAARHFMECGESIPWWKFTEQGKKLLAAQAENTKTSSQA